MSVVLLLAASANARSLPQPTLTASAGGAARKDEHPLIRPVSGGLASCTAEICTLPIDRTKVMMQIATDSKGLVGTMRNVIEKEGAGALFKGAKPALLRQASYQSIKMALYEPIRDAVMRAFYVGVASAVVSLTATVAGLVFVARFMWTS